MSAEAARSISIKIDKSLVDAHFPVLPRSSPFAVGTFSGRYSKLFRGRGTGPDRLPPVLSAMP